MMDNFIDRLAQKFTSGEIIKANTVAEERELKRIREQATKYEECLQDMRKQQYINMESTQNIRELIDRGSQHLELIYKDNTKKLEDASSEYTEKLNRLMQEALTKIEAITVEKESNEELEKIQEEIQNIQRKLEESTENLLEAIHVENVKVYRNVQAALVDQLKGQTSEILNNSKEEFTSTVNKGLKKLNPWFIVTILLLVLNLVATVVPMFYNFF